MPRYEAIEWTEKVEVGESSGSTRSSWSRRNGFSARRSFWLSSGHSGSVSSGRTYYREKRVFLCPTCYANLPKPVESKAEQIGRALALWLKRAPLRNKVPLADPAPPVANANFPERK